MRPFPSRPLAVSCVLALAVSAAVTPAGADDRRAAQERVVQPLVGRPDGTVLGTRGTPQTSDGVVGAVARDVPPSLRTYRQTRAIRKWQVVPGVSVTTWDEYDGRGRIRAYLLSVKYRAKGVTVDYANAGPVRSTATVATMLARDKAVAGVNGDFFDIGDTGAPLGVGRDRDRGLLNGPLTGWNSAFSISAKGNPDISALQTVTRIKEHPRITITNLNSPEVAIGGIGVYTPAWGYTSGYRVTGGQQSGVRAVTLRDGRVVSNRTRLPVGTRITGRVLVGRGQGAERLRALRPGNRVTVSSYVQGQPKVAITGNKFLVRDGLIEVVDDREMHPRTAIGIDRDTRTLLLLAIDGRQSFSRGYTMVELADTMIDLGADEALNLDGGGSTTMVARRPGRGVGVVNSPSDGVARSVANAIAIRYRRP